MTEGKRLLFIGLGFYDYDSAICDRLRSMGYVVDYVKTVPSSGIVHKLLKKLRLNSLLCHKIDEFVNRGIAGASVNNDIVFVIKGENLSAGHLSHLKKSNPHARFILYLWDNLNKIANKDVLLPCFDKILSFDRLDCIKYENFEFRPLFYLRTGEPDHAHRYDLSFIGEDRPGRYKFLKKISSIIPKDKVVYFRLKSSVLRTVLDKVTGKRLCNNLRLPYDEFCRITGESAAVLDIVEENQSGLTMRTIESLALGKHLYTTNDEICYTPYISPSSYTVLDVDNPRLQLGKKGGQDDDFYRYFCLGQFLLDILK